MSRKILSGLILISAGALGLQGCQDTPTEEDVESEESALSHGPPRPVAPLSGSIAGSRRPELRWAGARRALIEVCADRRCRHSLQTFIGFGDDARPPHALPPGVVFWRLLASGRHGRVISSPTWELFVPPRGGDATAVRGLRYDADADGFADAAVREQQFNLSINRVHVYPGAPSGIRSARETVIGLDAINFGSGFSAAGDVNGDGYGDLAVQGGPGVQIFAGSASGVGTTPATTLTPPPDILVGNFGFQIEAGGDVDGDGYGDLFLSDLQKHVWLYRGSAAGLRTTAAWVLEAPGADNVRIGTAADLDGDGFGDLVVIELFAPVDPNPPTQQLRVFHGGRRGLEPPTAGTPLPWPTVPLVTAGDVNGDGISDLVATESGAIVVLAGGPGGPTSTRIGGGIVPPLPFIGPLQSGDFDGDGFFDLAATNSEQTSNMFFTNDRIVVYAGSAGGLIPAARTSLLETAYFANNENNFGASLGNADFDGDRREDLLVGAPPPFPTPFFDTSPSAAFVFRGATSGVETTPRPRIDGLPGFGNSVTAGAP